MKNLFVDLEVIAANNGQIFEEEIAKVEFKASQKYLDYINDLFINNTIQEDEYRLLSQESYDYKDRVLEEVDEKYKGKVDFTKIYEINESNSGIIDYINKISLIINTYIVFYYNTEREKREKESICKKYFPTCKTIGVKFYQEEYNNNIRRDRTNKAKFIKSVLGLKDLSNCLLIDKSKLCCYEWSNLNGAASLYCNPKNDNFIKLGKKRG